MGDSESERVNCSGALENVCETIEYGIGTFCRENVVCALSLENKKNFRDELTPQLIPPCPQGFLFCSFTAF